MSFPKKIAAKFIRLKIENQVNKSDLSPEQKANILTQWETGIDLLSTDFENGAKSSLKSTAAFIMGFLTGGPGKAFADGIQTADMEAKKNTDLYIKAALQTGLPVSVNGVLINAQALEAKQMLFVAEKNRIVNTAAGIGVAGVLIAGGMLWWMFTPEKKSKQS
jgi:hypothetical protein